MTTAYVIYTEDGHDQTVFLAAHAKRETKDLTKMGCTVKVYTLEGEGWDIEHATDAMNDWFRDKGTLGRKALANIAAKHNVSIK